MNKKQKSDSLNNQLELAASAILARRVKDIDEHLSSSFQTAVFADVCRGKVPVCVKDWAVITRRWLRMQEDVYVLRQIIDSVPCSISHFVGLLALTINK